jgi:hypothetical protein
VKSDNRLIWNGNYSPCRFCYDKQSYVHRKTWLRRGNSRYRVGYFVLDAALSGLIRAQRCASAKRFRNYASVVVLTFGTQSRRSSLLTSTDSSCVHQHGAGPPIYIVPFNGISHAPHSITSFVPRHVQRCFNRGRSVTNIERINQNRTC